jgi:hypothetical protein
MRAGPGGGRGGRRRARGQAYPTSPRPRRRPGRRRRRARRFALHAQSTANRGGKRILVPPGGDRGKPGGADGPRPGHGPSFQGGHGYCCSYTRATSQCRVAFGYWRSHRPSLAIDPSGGADFRSDWISAHHGLRPNVLRAGVAGRDSDDLDRVVALRAHGEILRGFGEVSETSI